jgi:hypothetical protein
LFKFKESFVKFVSNPDGMRNNTKFAMAVEIAQTRNIEEEMQAQISAAVAAVIAKAPPATPRGLGILGRFM